LPQKKKKKKGNPSHVPFKRGECAPKTRKKKRVVSDRRNGVPPPPEKKGDANLRVVL